MSKKFASRSFLALALVVIMLLGFVPTTAFASEPPIRGYSSSAQTVYTGPSSSLYVSVGSVSKDELIYILGTEEGWYHIVYNVNSGGQKSGYVPMSKVYGVSGGSPGEDSFWGGYVISNSKQTVYSCDDYSTKLNIGSISAQEGVTKLYGYNSTASNGQVYPVYFVEYSTSSGIKRGYIFNPNFTEPIVTSVARMKASCNLVYGFYHPFNDYYPDTPFGKSGSVSAGELVCIVAKNGDNVEVEYNTKSGRKRGHISSSYLHIYNNNGLVYPDVAFKYRGNVESVSTYNVSHDVYSGPSSAYPVIGYIPAPNWYLYDKSRGYNDWYPVQYCENGVLKGGYVHNPAVTYVPD